MSEERPPLPRFTAPVSAAGNYEPQIDEEELRLDEQALLDEENPPPPVAAWKRWVAMISLALGCFSLCAWMMPYFGMPLSLVAVAAGAVSLRSDWRKPAGVGLILGVISFLLALMNLMVGVYGLLWQQG